MISPRSLLLDGAAHVRRAGCVALAIAIAAACAHPASAQARRQSSPYAFGATVSGRGAPMILIAGLASSGSVWNGVVAHYRDRYQVHVLQLPGMVGQPAVSDTAVLARVATDVQRYIRDKRLRYPVVAGHSVGGLVALRIAIESPAAVGPVISVDGLPFGAVVQMPGATAVAMRPIAAAIRTAYGHATPQQLEGQMRAGAAGLTLTPGFADTLAAWMGRSDPTTLGNVTAEAITTDLRDRVALIQVPALLLGTYGASTDSTVRIGTRASYESQVSAIPRHRVAIAQQARHFIMIDDLPWFLTQMDAFLAEFRR
jgi:N-formylmaleamate deformylase